ncbi:hypothetical protein HOA92_01630 [archaeon]|jgi:preprotein translocase subunit SecD|nr:hypothetical protein [archaeon]MBT6761713.1 hypothetical protein [archaeon]
MGKLKQIFTNWRVLLLLFVVILALTSIFTASPSNWFATGVNIDSIETNSSAAIAGISSPSSGTHPLQQERILEIDGSEITNIDEFYDSLSFVGAGETITITTNQFSYVLLVKEEDVTTGVAIDLGITVSEIPSNNLRKGLDLAGGTRVLLQPVEPVDDEIIEVTISNLYERLNVYGLSDISISPAKDLAGDQFIVIEIAGASESEVRSLLEEQGKFEAVIGNQTVFSGGDKDITYVCRSADCSGIDPNAGCGQLSDGSQSCRFFFSITLSGDAAQRQADATRNLDVSYEGASTYLSEDLILYLDDVEVDRLRIGSELQGRATTQIQISGSGAGTTQENAIDDTLNQMNRLQTIMITGSLPVQLEIVKMDTVSALLGEEFLQNLLMVAAIAVLAVFTVIFIRYRKWIVAAPMSLIMLSEILLILGFAAAVSWNLDLAAFAGIIIAAGTGVDHLIIITDETLRGEKLSSLKARVKNAMFIVMGAYFTTTVGMIPLWFAGAGLLKGFAFTTIVGITLGVFIARPAYAAIIKIMLEEEE